MSKASEWVKRWTKPKLTLKPSGAEPTYQLDKEYLVSINDDGNLVFIGRHFFPEEALRLRDWLTETFED